MGLKEYIIDDSSRHPNRASLIGKEYSIRVGMVRDRIYVQKGRETKYIVEVWKENKLYPMTCTRTSRFGGLYNFEEYNYRGFKAGEDNASLGNFQFIPGDQVIVAAMNGESREGIILGCIKHRGRDEVLPSVDNEIAYISEFNGLQTAINKSGEYRVTFKGCPTNIKNLENAPTGSEYEQPKYDLEKGYSYYEFDKDGSFMLTDNSNDENPQYIRVDKPSGKIEIVSGKTSFVIDKAVESYTITNKSTTFEAADDWNLNTKATTIKSTDIIEMETSAFKTKGDWQEEGNKEIKGNIKQTGNLELDGELQTTGPTSLAGGSHPLVYDIALTIGVGNLGAPVISNHVFLKTVKTKAT